MTYIHVNGAVYEYIARNNLINVPSNDDALCDSHCSLNGIGGKDKCPACSNTKYSKRFNRQIDRKKIDCGHDGCFIKTRQAKMYNKRKLSF